MTTGKSMSDPRTDAELLDSVRSRDDREALTELLERHQAAIWRFGMRMCRDVEDAKDVLQETMLAVARMRAIFAEARVFRLGCSRSLEVLHQEAAPQQVRTR